MKLFFQLFVILSLVSHAESQLIANQLGLVVNERSPESLELGSYYAAKRGVPENHILRISVDPTDNITRKDYETKIVLPLREQLEKNGIAGSVRALAIFYGVPLKVLALEPNADEQEVLLENSNAAQEAILKLQSIVVGISNIRGKKIEPASIANISPQDLINKAVTAIKEFGEKPGPFANAEDENKFKLQLQTYITDISGLAGLSQSIQITDPSSPAGIEFEKLKGDIKRGKELLMAADRINSPKYRRTSMQLTKRLFGAVGVLQRAAAFAAIFSTHESDAAVDSELPLLWWDHNQYQVSSKIPSTFYHRSANLPTQPMLQILPVLMTSRLDGPSVSSVKKMIDDSITVEISGLKGDFYIDARGMAPDGTELAKYDQKLRDLGWMFREDAGVSPQVQNTESRYSNKGDATNVALYIGWYKLRDYEDGFQFNPGSFGFHVASEEAANLHDPQEKGWCKNALERGISGTLGAVAEPYLDAFPQPVEFFGLLLSGRYTLAETYFLASPYMSWRMTLIGDPLYTPFKSKPLIKDSAFAKRSETGGSLNPLPPPPSSREFPNPIAGRKTLLDQIKKTEKELESLKLD
jgi:uncharacterized protein (TIGR03790 family)